MKCVICKSSDVQPGTTKFTVERDGRTYVLRKVPARVCRQCGEAYFDDDVTQKIMEQVDHAVRSGAENTVMEYNIMEDNSADEKGKLSRALRKVLDWALAVDRDKAVAFVNDLKREHPGESRRQLADRIISRARWWGAGAGFTTGLPANPWFAAPAAVTDIGAVLAVELRMASRIALLFDPAYFDDPEPPYELLVPIIGGRAAAEFMRELAIRGGMGVSREAIRKILTKETLAQFRRIMLKYFGMKLGQRGLITKTLPVVGGVIGGGWNYAEIKIVSDRVYSYFDGYALGDAP